MNLDSLILSKLADYVGHDTRRIDRGKVFMSDGSVLMVRTCSDLEAIGWSGRLFWTTGLERDVLDRRLALASESRRPGDLVAATLDRTNNTLLMWAIPLTLLVATIGAAELYIYARDGRRHMLVTEDDREVMEVTRFYIEIPVDNEEMAA